MTTAPFISVIIPTYNGERFLQECLESVLIQDHPHREILVVDDGSKDRSADIAREFPEIRLICQSNQGVAEARNRGIRESTGEFLAFLDQDDQWVPEKLSSQAAYFQKNPETDYILAHEELLFQPGSPGPTWLKEELWHRPHPGFNLGTALIRRSFFERVGDFDTGLRYCSDGDWLLRAASLQPRVFMPEVLLRKRVHEANESNQTEAMREEFLRIMKRSMARGEKSCPT